MFDMVIAKRLILRVETLHPPYFTKITAPFILVYTLKLCILGPIPTSGFLISEDPLLNILGGRSVILGSHCIKQYYIVLHCAVLCFSLPG